MDNVALTAIVDGAADPSGPGLAAGIYRGGVLRAHASSGLASVEFRSPIDEHTRFDIASVSKQFTATAILLLVRDGLVRLDDDIRAHLPELRTPSPVTIAQCLQHTGGLPEWYSLAAVAGRSLCRMSQDDLLAFATGFTTLNFAPGAEFGYSNTGYALAASLVRRLTGRSLGEFTAERIFSRLGMRRSFFREDTRAVVPGFASGYTGTGRDCRRADTEEDAVGDGGLATSVDDLAAWFRFLRDGDALGADIRDALLEGTPRFPDGECSPYAYGIWHTSIDGIAVVGHAGGVEGYASQLLYAPELDLGVVVLANSSAIGAGAIATRILRLAAGLPEGARSAPPVEAVDDDAHDLRAAGWWIARDTEQHVETTLGDDGTLHVRGTLAGAFRRSGRSTWRGEGDLDGVQVRIHGTQLRVRAVMRPGRDLVFDACAAPEAELPVPSGTYVDEGLGVSITIHDDGGFRIGPRLRGVLEAGPDRTFLAEGAVLRRDGDDILLSVDGARRLRFLRDREPATSPTAVTARTP